MSPRQAKTAFSDTL